MAFLNGKKIFTIIRGGGAIDNGDSGDNGGTGDSGGTGDNTKNLTLTSWKLNDALTSSTEAKTFKINFISNGAKYTDLVYLPENGLFFDGANGSKVIWDKETGEWDDAYKTIIITGGADATNSDCYDWFTANATKLTINLINTTWKFNNTIDIASAQYNINFTANGNSYKGIELFSDTGEGAQMYYINSSGMTKAYYSNAWVDENYQTIKLTSGADLTNADFMQMLFNNAIQVTSSGGGEETTTYTITNNLSNCVSTNTATKITSGATYSATITANDGYTLSSVVVTMGGTNITAMTVNGGTISITDVTGDIVITANATEIVDTTTYTITNNLSNCVSTNTATKITSGATYSATITANDGYTLSSVVVTMGGTNVTAMAVNGGTISITDVTGDIVITANATEIVETTTYTVVFKNYDGTVLKTQTGILSGGSATAPTDPTRTGYTFTGWDKSFTNVTSDLTITAQYRINTYTVTFNSNGGSTVTSQTVNYGATATKPTDPTYNGYNFVSWQLNSVDYDFTKPVTANITLVAKWQAATTADFDGTIWAFNKKLKINSALNTTVSYNVNFTSNGVAYTAINLINTTGSSTNDGDMNYIKADGTKLEAYSFEGAMGFYDAASRTIEINGNVSIEFGEWLTANATKLTLTNLLETSWIINDTPNQLLEGTYKIAFHSGTKKYFSLNFVDGEIDYEGTLAYSNGWEEEDYKIITITTGVSTNADYTNVDLIIWLQNNATQAATYLINESNFDIPNASSDFYSVNVNFLAIKTNVASRATYKSIEFYKQDGQIKIYYINSSGQTTAYNGSTWSSPGNLRTIVILDDVSTLDTYFVMWLNTNAVKQ